MKSRTSQNMKFKFGTFIFQLKRFDMLISSLPWQKNVYNHIVGFQILFRIFDIDTKHLRNFFFKICPVSKQLCIIIFQVKFIQVLSGVTEFFTRPIAKNYPKMS